MKKGLIRRLAVAAMAAIMMVGAGAPAMNVSANDGRGIYAEDGMSVKTLNKTVKITASEANVREGAGTSYRVVNVLHKGDKVTLTGEACRYGERTGWYQITTKDKKYGGETSGYIYKSLFEDADDDVNYGTKKTVTGTKNYLALRDEASSDDDAEIARLYNGYTVRVLSNEGKYSYVYSENLGLEGYVKSAYLK